MSKNMHRLLSFAMRYPGWHTCSKDSVRSMMALEARGYVKVVRYENSPPQFRLNTPE